MYLVIWQFWRNSWMLVKMACFWCTVTSFDWRNATEQYKYAYQTQLDVVYTHGLCSQQMPLNFFNFHFQCHTNISLISNFKSLQITINSLRQLLLLLKSLRELAGKSNSCEFITLAYAVINKRSEKWRYLKIPFCF